MNFFDLKAYLESPEGQQEKNSLPQKLSQGMFQSWNSDNESVVVLAEYIRRAKPKAIVECGTFEGRTTEYLTKILRESNDNKATLITIDTVNEHDDPLYKESISIRYNRLFELQKDNKVTVLYFQGRTQQILPFVMRGQRIDFVYEDADHTLSGLIEDWRIINNFASKGTVVCFDDMRNHPFVGWFSENNLNWTSTYINIGAGQLWARKND
jgi:predicted O-methyltransferase YrrM